MGAKWHEAHKEKCWPNWSIFTSEYIAQICQATSVANPTWHSDLTALDISAYLAGMSPKKFWWLADAPSAPETLDDMWPLSSSVRISMNTYFSHYGQVVTSLCPCALSSCPHAIPSSCITYSCLPGCHPDMHIQGEGTWKSSGSTRSAMHQSARSLIFLIWYKVLCTHSVTLVGHWPDLGPKCVVQAIYLATMGPSQILGYKS